MKLSLFIIISLMILYVVNRQRREYIIESNIIKVIDGVEFIKMNSHIYIRDQFNNMNRLKDIRCSNIMTDSTKCRLLLILDSGRILKLYIPDNRKSRSFVNKIKKLI